jgi:hypothetical protein
MRNNTTASLAAVLMLAVLPGCTTWGDIDRGLDTLTGKPLDYAISKLGLPDAEQTIAGRKVYVWDSRTVGGGYLVPKTTNYSGNVGGTSYAGTDTGLQATPSYDLYCKLKLVVDGSNTVTSYDYDGNMGACERYARLQ